MSIQGFAGGLMQGYDFMEDQYDRRDRRQRLDRQESRAESREARAQDQYETNKSLALEQREWAEKQRKDQERLNMIRSAQYKVQNGIPLSAEEQETLNVQMQDPKTQSILQNIQKNPKKANQQARNIKLAIEGKADLNKAIEDGNELLKPFIQQGAGKNKRIDGIIPVGKKAYAKLSYEDEDYGTPIKDAPLTTNRSKNDYLVRDLDLGRLYTAADYLDQLSAMAIQLGDTTPIERQAAQEGQMRELGLKLFERGLDREDMAIEHGYDMEKSQREARLATIENKYKDRRNTQDNKTRLQIAAMKARGKDDSKLGDIPEDVLNDPMLQRPVTDESGEPVLDLNTMQPVMETNWGEVSQIRDMMTQYGIKDWRQGVLLYKREVKPKLDEQRAQAEYKVIADELANMEPGEAKRKLESRFDRREQEKVLSNLPEPKRKEILMGKKITPKEASPPAVILDIGW